MQTLQYLQLSTGSQRQLASQVTQNGTFDHPLICCTSSEVRANVRLTIEQCCKGLTARVEIGESVNSITFAKREDNGHRLAVFVESLANDCALPANVPEVDEYLLVSDLEGTLRAAIRECRGTFYLAVDGVEDLALLLRQSQVDPRRTAFNFELGGVCQTLAVLLPTDRELAYELLNGCVQELAANFRNAA